MIFSAQRHSTRHVWRLPRPPVSPVPHTKSHVTCVSAHAQQNQKKPNTAPRGARRGASICTGDQTIESSVVGCVEHDVERVCPVRWQCQREKIEEELERERNRKRRPKCENGKISALLRLLPTRPHTARQSGQRRGPYPYLQLNAWGKEPMRTKQSAPLDTGLTSRDPKGALPNPIFVVLACCRQCLPGAPKCRNDQIRI